MKTAASVFSWLGGAMKTLFAFIIIATGQQVNYIIHSSYYDSKTSTTPYSTWMWLVWFIILIARIFILIWRQTSVDNGYKVACGIVTLIFVSFIGGLLTLLIPDDELGVYYSAPTPQQTYNRPNKTETSFEQFEKRLKNYKYMLDMQIITQEEFDQKKKELFNLIDNETLSPHPTSLSASEILSQKKYLSKTPKNSAEILSNYKTMLDLGIITQEEFEAKKKQIF